MWMASRCYYPRVTMISITACFPSLLPPSIMIDSPVRFNVAIESLPAFRWIHKGMCIKIPKYLIDTMVCWETLAAPTPIDENLINDWQNRHFAACKSIWMIDFLPLQSAFKWLVDSINHSPSALWVSESALDSQNRLGEVYRRTVRREILIGRRPSLSVLIKNTRTMNVSRSEPEANRTTR